VAEIEAFARLVGETPKTFFRLGYGFTRQRNGAVNMHAASCIAAVTGAWQHEGGGAFHNNGAIYGWDKSLIEGTDARDPRARCSISRRSARILTGDAEALRGGPPVKALFIQNTNPVNVAPEQALVRQGFAREDLFTVRPRAVHDRDGEDGRCRAAGDDVPRTRRHVYQGGGHQHIMPGRKLIEPPGECRSNHEVICDLAARVGAAHPGFAMTPAAHDRSIFCSPRARHLSPN
jgi:anaerobic selenocysteine-containing dehydrogenase